jgi:RNA polymerase sigma factor (sigma-70 family)
MKRLSNDIHKLMEEYFHIPRIVAWKFYKYNKKFTLDELISSANFGLCKAFLRSKKPDNYSNYIWSACKNQIYKDVGYFYNFKIGSSQILYHDSLDDILSTKKELEIFRGMIEEEEKQMLNDALEKIDKKYYDIIKLKISGLSTKEIAVRLKRKSDTINRLVKFGILELNNYIYRDTIKVSNVCLSCEKPLVKKGVKFCSYTCQAAAKKIAKWPTYEEMISKMKEIGRKGLARELGVTPQAISDKLHRLKFANNKNKKELKGGL